jgi:hypothetical protein
MLLFSIIIALLMSININAKVPDWVKNFDSSQKYPSKSYLTGFGVATGDIAEATVIAQEIARGEISRTIVVSINSMLTAVKEEKNEQYSQEFSSITQSSSSLQDIKGLNIEKFVESEKNQSTVYALAYVSRADLKKLYTKEKQDLIKQINTIITDAQSYENTSEVMDAVTKYLSLYPLYERLKEAETVLVVIGGSSIEDAFNELDKEIGVSSNAPIMTQTEVAIKVDRLLSESINSLTDIARSVVLRLAKQISTPTEKMLIVPLTYQDTKMGSSFSRQFRAEIENQFIQIANWKIAEQLQSFNPKSSQIMRDMIKDSGANLIFSGTYWEQDNEVKLMVNIRDIDSGKVLAGTDLSFDSGILPSNIELKPENYESALTAQGAFSQGEIVSSQLRVEAWTNKGNDNVMYSAGETMKLFVRVNREAYLRFLYVLADGRWTLLYDDYYIDRSKANQAVELPIEFECAPPFGAEMLVVIARTEKFNQTETIEEDGYYFINKEPTLPQVKARSLASLIRNERGMKPKKQSVLATLNQKILNEFERNEITDLIRQEFDSNGISLSQNSNISMTDEGIEWLINDIGNQQTYLIKLEDQKLNVYRIQQSETKLIITTME